MVRTTSRRASCAAWLALACVVGCGRGATAESGNTGDSGNSGDSADTGNSGSTPLTHCGDYLTQSELEALGVQREELEDWTIANTEDTRALYVGLDGYWSLEGECSSTTGGSVFLGMVQTTAALTTEESDLFMDSYCGMFRGVLRYAVDAYNVGELTYGPLDGVMYVKVMTERIRGQEPIAEQNGSGAGETGLVGISFSRSAREFEIIQPGYGPSCRFIMSEL